jgi:hypothetical protein
MICPKTSKECIKEDCAYYINISKNNFSSMGISFSEVECQTIHHLSGCSIRINAIANLMKLVK